MAQLALFLFGAPRIERDGAPVTVDTHKALALLAYLVTTGRPESRDTLAAFLWPNHEQARGILRRTLSPLRSTLGDEWFVITRETIGLRDPQALWTDTSTFRRLLAARLEHSHAPNEVCADCLPLLADAVELQHSDFLAGFHLRDCAPFDDWRAYQSDLLRRDLVEALERLSRGCAERRQLDLAIQHAQRWLAADALSEAAHRRLMVLYAWSGQRSAALQQYRVCAQTLERELGVAPLEATTQLYEAIRANRVTAPPRKRERTVGQSASPSSAVAHVIASDVTEIHRPLRQGAPIATDGALKSSGAVPFVGRAVEWARLVALYNGIVDGSDVDGRVALILGEAGIGKTRLAEELLAHVRARGASVISVRSYEGESGLAYGSVTAALRAALAQPGWTERMTPQTATEVGRLVPEVVARRPDATAAPPLDAPGARLTFFEAVCDALTAACEAEMASDEPSAASPGVLLLEDLHWADSASLDILTFLVRRLHGKRLLVIMTWRDAEAQSLQPLQRLLLEVSRDETATVLKLPRLPQSAIRELTQALASEGERGLPRLSERLYAETEGVPLFLAEYLRALRSGLLDTTSQEWSLPGGVRDLLRARLIAIGETGWQMLHTIAVIGRSFDFETAREVSGRSEEETVAALEEFMACGIVAEARGVTQERGALLYDFTHEKLRALVYDETSLARRRLLHRRLAETLAGRAQTAPGRGALAPTIARHFALGGVDAQAASYFKLAGDYARALGAHAEALAHFDAALAHGHPATAWLHEAIGDAQTMLGAYDAALKSYTLAAALADSTALPAIERKRSGVFARRGAWEAAQAHLESALDALGESDAAGERARIYANWSFIALQRAQIETALSLAQEALRLAQAEGDAPAVAQALNILGILASRTGDHTQAITYLGESLALAQDMQDASARAAALNNLALAHAARGETVRARELAEQALAVGETLGDRHRMAALHNNLADILHAAGESATGMAHLKEAVTIYMEIGFEAGVWQPEIWKLSEW
jgi:DNA-binding SARP family transcriptional activator/tetratricopeptide (TPR) repeat protein